MTIEDIDLTKINQIDPITQMEYGEGVNALKVGDYRNGWKGWELRYGYGKIGETIWRSATDQRPRYYWDGKPSEGVILVDDQGYGDFFQFSRYIPLVQQLCKYVLVACKPGLPELILNSFSGNIGIIPFSRFSNGRMSFVTDTPYPYYHINSLGYLFQSTPETLPNNPYLKAETINIGKKIGVCWKTDITWVDNYNEKVIPDKFIKPIFQNYNAMSLQKEHLNVKNWFETASIINGLDVVISGDFSIAHLAGALGKPVWVMLSYDNDWRWGTKNTTPWYPTASLYRQEYLGDWEGVIHRIIHRIQQHQYRFQPNLHN